jgi:cell growth-regulating nucleolar protein
LINTRTAVVGLHLLVLIAWFIFGATTTDLIRYGIQCYARRTSQARNPKLISSQSCMTEEQKYQGALYKNKKAKTVTTNTQPAQKDMAHAAYVEDVADYEGWEDLPPAPPHAPSPPAAFGEGFNVFDYQVDATPSASTVAIPQVGKPTPEPAAGSTELVRYEYKKESYQDIDADMMADDEALVQYGSGPVLAEPSSFHTPAPRRDRKKASKEDKKDKKRKRLHVDTRDLDMPDAPVLHSDLTGGLNRLMSRPHAFPPSPDYSGSGGEVNENPASPLKKSKQSKHHKSSRPESGIFTGIASMLASGNSKPATKSKKRKHTSTPASASTKKRHSHTSKRLEGAKEVKMLEYNKGDEEESRDGPGTMVVFKPHADSFLSLIKPDSDRGCSVNKILKRWHRQQGSTGRTKSLEEKELFRSLRLRRNDQGEIVLFSVPAED